MQFSAVVRKEGRLLVALCPELDIASQGRTIKSALSNLKEAVAPYLEDEDALVPRGSPIITTFEVQYAKAARSLRA